MTEAYTGADDPEIANYHYSNPDLQNGANHIFDKMRDKCPIAHSDRFDGFWIFSKYDDVFRAYQEPNLFSSYPNPIPPNGIGSDRPVIPVETDPPDHTKYRQILMPLFTTHRLRALDAKIVEHTTDLIDRTIEKGGCEYVMEFAEALPTRIFLEMMGFPLEDAGLFRKWTNQLMREPSDDPEESLRIKEEVGMELAGYFAEELDRRDGIEPVRGDGADFIDWLRGASFGGERPLTQFEILDCLYIILLAGLDTVQGVLTLSMEFLATHDEYRKELVEHPERIDTAVEELLRWFAPVQPGRRLTEDLEMRGVKMSKDDRVLLLMGSACRDEDEFPNANTVDFQRLPNRHIAFGAGAHRCLGSHIARSELRTAIGQWHQRIPNYRIKPGAPMRRHLSAVQGLDEMHLEILPAD